MEKAKIYMKKRGKKEKICKHIPHINNTQDIEEIRFINYDFQQDFAINIENKNTSIIFENCKFFGICYINCGVVYLNNVANFGDTNITSETLLISKNFYSFVNIVKINSKTILLRDSISLSTNSINGETILIENANIKSHTNINFTSKIIYINDSIIATPTDIDLACNAIITKNSSLEARYINTKNYTLMDTLSYDPITVTSDELNKGPLKINVSFVEPLSRLKELEPKLIRVKNNQS